MPKGNSHNYRDIKQLDSTLLLLAEDPDKVPVQYFSLTTTHVQFYHTTHYCIQRVADSIIRQIQSNCTLCLLYRSRRFAFNEIVFYAYYCLWINLFVVQLLTLQLKLSFRLVYFHCTTFFLM